MDDDISVFTPGNFSFDELASRASLKWSTYPGCLPAWVAETDFPTAPEVQEALAHAVRREQFGYVSNSLRDGVASATVGWMAENLGWDVRSEQVKTIPDVLAAYEFALDFYLDAGSKVIVPTPTYYPFLVIAKRRGIGVVEVPLENQDGRWVLTPPELQCAFDEGGKLLVLCDPHNPTGTILTVEEQLDIASVVDANRGRVFSDLIHAPIAEQAPHPYAGTSLVAARHTISAIATSKAWNTAGLKAAQMVLTNDSDLKGWGRLGGRISNMASPLGVVAAVAAYESDPAWLRGFNAYISANRITAQRSLEAIHPGLRAATPKGTYFEWLDLSQVSADPSELAHVGVALSHGSDMGAGFENYARLNLGAHRDTLTAILDRLARLSSLTS
jgi:cystathionine beta-lyase